MDKNKIGIFFVALILLGLFAFRLWQTTGCRQFKSFYLNPQAVTIRVEEDVNSDQGLNRNVSRFFHNKAQTAVILAGHTSASALDARMLLEILGPLGLAAIVISLHTVAKNKNKFGIFHLVLVLVGLLVVTFSANAKLGFYLLASGFYSFSLWSTKTLANYKILVLALAAISFWFFTLSWQQESFCHDIFFH